MHITLKGLATELSRNNIRQDTTCAGFFDATTFYIVRIHRMIYNFLQNTVKKTINDGHLEYNPKVYCGNITVLYCGKM